MDIKRLLTKGGEPFAAEIVDADETYKVFLESLENDVMLPELIKSGWKLTSLPFTLKKDGVALENLPKMEYSPSTEEELEMYDMIGTKMSIDAKRAYLSEDEMKTITIAEGQYFINTREELLSYLDLIAKDKCENDFLPLNYFVHPNALFSLEEYRDANNSVYVSRIEARRHMGLDKFLKLREWALNNGLKQDFTPIDFLSFYFQWGMCGLRLNILSKEIMECYTLSGVSAFGKASMACLNEFALIDRNQQIYKRAGTEDYKPYDEKSAVLKSQRLRDNETAVIKTVLPATETIEKWVTSEVTIEIGARGVFMGFHNSDSIVVDGKFGCMYSMYWNPKEEENMNNDMFLRAMAEDFIDRRKKKVEVSSYKALLDVGCSPKNALLYISKGFDLNMDSIGAEPKIIDYNTVLSFLRGEEIDTDADSLLRDIMDGVVNIDNVAKGMAMDAAQDADTLYTQLYCINHVLNIPAEKIYEELVNYKDSKFLNGDSLLFTNGYIVVPVVATPITGAYDGYKLDMEIYREEQVNTATSMLYVVEAARELGPEDATRHVAIKGYTLSVTSAAEAALKALQNKYEEYVTRHITNPVQIKAYIESGRMVAVGMLFSAAIKGFYTFPKEITKEAFKVTPEERSTLRSLIKGPSVDTTLVIADNAIYNYPETPWHWYCVNAIVTPYKVRPRAGQKVNETSLCAVWADMKGRPEFAELKRRGLVENDSVCWSALSTLYPIIPEYREDDVTLRQYYDNAMDELNNYDHSLAFKAAQHPLGMQYKLLMDKETEETPGENEEYKFKAGNVKTLMKDIPDATVLREDYVPITRFVHMEAEDFYQAGGKLEFPKSGMDGYFKVLDPFTLFCNGKIIRPADVESLSSDEYPISHMHGQKYLIRDIEGRYWIVRA